MQAALGLAQLEQIDEFLNKKRAVGKFYDENIGHLKKYGFHLPLSKTDYAENIYWVYGIVAPTEDEKTMLTQHLKNKQIGHRPFFWPMHQQPVLNSMHLFLFKNSSICSNCARPNAACIFVMR